MMYILNVTTESGDRDTFVFEYAPTSDEVVENFLRRYFPEEYEQVGFVNWELNREYVSDWGN